jgi:outer membrane protein assembly factor BamB
MRRDRVAVLSLLFCYWLALCAARGEDWPQWLGRNRDGVWRETNLLEKFPKGGPKIVWRTPIGSGFSGPAVAGGHVLVMDRIRAKDPDGKPTRSTRDGVPGTERILCLRESDGQLLWKDEYECPYKISYSSGPRTTLSVQNDRVYSLGAMGDLRCLDASTGKVRWARNVARDYHVNPPVWGYSASPLVDQGRVYCLVGGPGSAVVAFDADNGKEIWRALTTSEICYSPPMIYEIDGKRELIIWHSDSINGLDPETGRLYWGQKYPADGKPQRPAVSIATVRQAGNRLFLSSAYHGPMMLRIEHDTPQVVWQKPNKDPEKPESLCILMPSPVLRDGYVYGVGIEGELRCLRMENGAELWQTYGQLAGKKADCGTAFLIPQGDRFVIFNDLGDLIFARLSPEGYQEFDRAHIVEPVQSARGRHVVWSHPAFADSCVFARNDNEIICVSLASSTN